MSNTLTTQPEANGLSQTAQAVNSLPAIFSRPLGKLAGALAKAQKMVRAVAHDATNSFHRYDYTSSEAVIEAAKDPLSDNELAVIPLEETLDGPRIETTVKGGKEESEARYELQCKFLLVHSSGESMLILRHWPVCPDKGRPLDKATAASSTIALSYMLRDLLLMPRVAKEDEIAAREERPAKQAAPQTITEDQASRLNRLLEDSGRTWAKGMQYLKLPENTKALSLTLPQYQKLAAACEKAIGEAKAKKTVQASKGAAVPGTPPLDGKSLATWINGEAKKLNEAGAIPKFDALVEHVRATVKKAGANKTLPAELSKWDATSVALGYTAAQYFIADAWENNQPEQGDADEAPIEEPVGAS